LIDKPNDFRCIALITISSLCNFHYSVISSFLDPYIFFSIIINCPQHKTISEYNCDEKCTKIIDKGGNVHIMNTEAS